MRPFRIMTLSVDFPPDPFRAVHLNRSMHASLADSLRHIRERCEGVIDFDRPAVDTLIANLEQGHSYAPVTFSYYYELVPALLAGDASTAAAMFEALARSAPIAPHLRIVALGGVELGTTSARYQRLMNSDPRLPVGLLPPGEELAADFRARLARGFELLDRSIPELAGEIRGIINEIVMVASDPAQPLQFDGGSHYQLWGALFLNAEFHQSDQAIVEVLAHESAHSLLFGFCTDTALVENADDELYASPLRPDRRPMDGIFHATFVSARMHWAMSRLLRSGRLDRGAQEAAAAAIAADALNFAAGYDVVAEHGRLTTLGRALMREAKSYMDAAHS